MRTKIKNILFIIGLASVVVMFLTFDVSWDVLWEDLCHAGYWLLSILLLWVVLYMMNTLTWWLILRESGPVNISFMRLMKITVSGFALNSATPVGLLGGEPYKIMELTPVVGAQRATSSVLLFAMTHIFTHFCYWVTAIILYIALYPIEMGIGIVLALSAVFCGAGVYLFVRGYKFGMVVRAIRWAGHLPGLRNWAKRFAETHAEDLHKIDCQIAELHSQSRRSFYSSLALEYVGRMMQSLEIMFMLVLFGDTWSWMTFAQSIIILAFTSLFANLLGFIPMQLGGREGGFAMSTSQLGLTGGVGLFISIICRVRELFFTCIGLALMKLDFRRDLLHVCPNNDTRAQKGLKFAILAAGEGSRLAEEGIAEPKPLVPLLGKPMIDRLLAIFEDCGAEEVEVITNDLTPQTREHIESLPMYQEGRLHLVVKTTPSSMHSFYELMPLLGKGPFILTPVDTIFHETEFRRYVETFIEDLECGKGVEGVEGVEGLMAVTDYVDDEKPLWVSTDEHLNITGFHDSQEQFRESGAAGECRFISGGIYGLTDKCFPTLIRCIESGQSRMRNFQRAMVADGLRLRAYPFSKILDVDHAGDVKNAEAFLTN